MSGGRGSGWYDEREIDKMDMLEACYLGDLLKVKDYVKCGKVLLDDSDDDGVTALQIAAARGNEELVRCFLMGGRQLVCFPFPDEVVLGKGSQRRTGESDGLYTVPTCLP